MLPVVGEVIGVGELVLYIPWEITQQNLVGVIGKIQTTVANTVLLAPDVKVVQVPTLPSHHDLNDMMELS